MDEPKTFIYVEPMGHGSHFVAEVVASSIVPGTVQMNVLRGDGSIDRTIGMSGAGIFRWSYCSQENALKLARILEERQTVWNLDLPQKLLLEAENSERQMPPAEREDEPDGGLAEDERAGEMDVDDEDDEDLDDDDDF